MLVHVHNVDAVRKRFRYSNPQDEWIWQSAWFQANWREMSSNNFLKPGWGQSSQAFRENQQTVAVYKFGLYLLNCTKPKLFEGASYEEPCNSPALEGCLCRPLQFYEYEYEKLKRKSLSLTSK